jgi:hypothetical protein
VLSDFEPVALHQIFYYILAVKKTLPANNLQELIAWLKANPDRASLGTAGVGNQTSPRGHSVPEPYGHPFSARSLSRRGPCHSGFDRWSN